MDNKKRFARLRALNRQRNYLMKALRLNIARWIWDHRSKRDFSIAESRSVLFLRDDDKIGDMVVSTSLFREFKRHGYHVSVLAGKNNSKVIENNPFIDKIFIVDEGKKKRLAQARFLSQKKYDVVIDMGDKISPFHLQFLKVLNAKNVVGFNKMRFNIYNKSLDYLGYDVHITGRYKLLMESLNFGSFSIDYDIHVPDEIRIEVSGFMSDINSSMKVVVNPFAADVRRDMSIEQLSTLIEKIKTKWKSSEVILVGDPDRIKELGLLNAKINPFTTLASACEIIHLADLVISPDTAVVHIAAAWKKPLIGLYGHDTHAGYVNNIVWAPGYNRARQIYTRDKYHPVSSIEVDDIMNAMSELVILEDS